MGFNGTPFFMVWVSSSEWGLKNTEVSSGFAGEPNQKCHQLVGRQCLAERSRKSWAFWPRRPLKLLCLAAVRIAHNHWMNYYEFPLVEIFITFYNIYNDYESRLKVCHVIAQLESVLFCPDLGATWALEMVDGPHSPIKLPSICGPFGASISHFLKAWRRSWPVAVQHYMRCRTWRLRGQSSVDALVAHWVRIWLNKYCRNR